MKNIMKSKKVYTLLIAGTLLGSSIAYSGQVQANKEGKTFEQLLIEWEAAGIDANHTKAIEKVTEYISSHVEPGTFASLHIDREENPLGVIVLSFTKELSEDQKKEIEALVEEPSEVSFRVVKYTEQQLMEKQDEINKAVFEEGAFKDAGITVYHTGTDIINNKVEIGISPYNEENVKIVKDYFGDDFISVVQGEQAQLLDGAANSGGAAAEADETPVTISADDIMPISANDIEPISAEVEKGFFSKIWAWFAGLFK